MRQLLAVLIAIVPALTFSQNGDPVEVGVGIGAAFYEGDLGSSKRELALHDLRFCASTHLRFNMNNHLALRMNLLAGQLKGTDNSFDDPAWRQVRGMSFTSPLIEISVLGEIYPFGLFTRAARSNTGTPMNAQDLRHRRRIAPYLMVGVGGAFRNPMVDWNEGRDNNGVDPILAQEDKTATIKGVNFVVPFGGGVRFAINDQFTIGLEGALRPTFTDYLDGVSQAGNPDQKDWYFTGGLTLSYSISEPREPSVHNPPAPVFAESTPAKPVKPDADSDGIPDQDDACPDVAGTRAMAGCPDSDFDNIPDKDDRCPHNPGKAGLAGCPDADGDGIPDKDDGCPSISGVAAKNGCPEFAVSVPGITFKSIFFATSKHHWYESSFTTIDEVAEMLTKDPKLNARLEGHADITGIGTNNFLLSEHRAKTCYEYLLKKGIQADRMEFVGYGSDRPASSNSTAQGRKLNRRVEIHFSY